MSLMTIITQSIEYVSLGRVGGCIIPYANHASINNPNTMNSSPLTIELIIYVPVGHEIALNYRRHDLANAALEFAVVGYWGADGDFGGGDGGDALGDHLGGVNE